MTVELGALPDAASALRSRGMSRALTRLWASALKRGLDAASAATDVPLEYDPTDPDIRAMFGEVATRIRDIEAETERRVRSYVERAREQGLGINGLAGLIREDASGAFGRKRARTIARTESAVGYNRSSVLGWKKSGRVTEATALDGPECGLTGHGVGEPVNGRTFPLEVAEKHPVAHPNCVRAWSPVIKALAADDGPSPRTVVPTAPGSIEAVASAETSEGQPAGTPVSGAFDIGPRPRSKVGKGAREALGAIDSVHGDGLLPRIPIQQNAGTRTMGQFTYNARSREPKRITVSSRGRHPAMTFAHEAGHFLDHQTLGPAPGSWGSQNSVATALNAGRGLSSDEMKALLATLRETEAVKSLQAMRGVWRTEIEHIDPVTGERRLEPVRVDGRFVSYLLDDKEIFARAYAQYIATKSGDARMLRELDEMRTLMEEQVYPTQWSDEDFGPVAGAFDTLLRAMGWIN